MKEVTKAILNILKEAELISAAECTGASEKIDFQALRGDGSARRFYRVFRGEEPIAIAVLPHSSAERDMSEAGSTLAIGRHLAGAGIPVPRILGAQKKSGLVVLEDLGDLRLHDLLRIDRTRGLERYRDAVEVLAKMQIRGAEGFDELWCCDGSSYNISVMRDRESDYFYRAFWQETLYGEEIEGLHEEFDILAKRTMNFYTPFFLHRDFQSRNIMIWKNEVRVIDFQAGRLGPPGYDIASLLIDPYAALSQETQMTLFNLYLEVFSRLSGEDTAQIASSYPYLAVQRNLQIIGAFAFLSGKKRKAFFLPYILPSLIMLHNRLSEDNFDGFPLLRKIVSLSIDRFRSHIRR